MGDSNVNVYELENTDDGEFYEAVRHAIMAMLVTVLLYMVSYVLICKFKKPYHAPDSSEENTEACVYRTAIYLCSFTLSVSLAASLLLPTSILCREILRHFPSWYYFKWINSTLIRGLWNGVFLCSNFSMFILMPFVYFFLESEGFSGSKGIVARLKETLTVLVLFSLVAAGTSLLVTRLLSWDTSSHSLSIIINFIFSDKLLRSPWFMYSYLYSVTSLIGSTVLLLCTPLGLARIFSVIGGIVMKPQLTTSLEEQISSLEIEKEYIQRTISINGYTSDLQQEAENKVSEIIFSLSNLERRKAMSPWKRNLVYPCVLLLLLFITGLSMFMVAFNILKLLLGYGPLPGIDESFDKEFLDSKYDSYMGSLGAVTEVLLVGYILIASLIGFYTTEWFTPLLPRVRSTTITCIIANCVVLLILSCSLPLVSATLGLTRFDLLGHFRTIDWLKNVHVILIYNLTFEALTALSLVKKVTTAVLREVYKQLQPPAPIRNKFYLHAAALVSLFHAIRPST